MGHEASVISSARMDEFNEYAQTAALPIWVVGRLSSEYEALGLYYRIASAATMEDAEKMCVTTSAAWSEALFGENGVLSEPMKVLMEIGAITRIARYKSGKARLRMEAYPPEIREEMDAYRRPNGKLVVAFA